MTAEKLTLGQFLSQIFPVHGLNRVAPILTVLLDDDYDAILNKTPTGGRIGNAPLLYGNHRVGPYSRGQLELLFKARNEIAHWTGDKPRTLGQGFADLVAGWSAHMSVAATAARSF